MQNPLLALGSNKNGYRHDLAREGLQLAPDTGEAYYSTQGLFTLLIPLTFM